jgi:SpoVK/Ycf46/Vps4 family AAA+-type ATPase
MIKIEKYTEIIQKKELISIHASKLKTEFIGLDDIIDEVLTLISPWYFFPEAQIRPTIINLWGLTGTGKTALIKRIVELFEMKDHFLHLDMGEYAGEQGAWIKTMLTDDMEHFHEKPSILCFDEFQFARTLDKNENELTRDKMRVLWELFDSGKIYYEPQGSGYYIKRAVAAIQLIAKCIKKEVTIYNGEITGNTNEFLSIFSGYYFDNTERYGQEITTSYFLSKDFTEGVKELFDTNIYSDVDIQNMIKVSTLSDIADFLTKGIQKELTVKQLDLSKSLIFILGNLDEAFYMSNELNPDLNADEFYAETLKINIADIKSALKKRFRNEQIARLGNNHIIYPCFNNKNYRLLIERNLDKISEYVKTQFGVTIHFDASVIEVIYEEGVFPSQGVRPVLTTIKQMVESYIGQVFCTIIEQHLPVCTISWKFQKNAYNLNFLGENGEQIGQWELFPKLKLNELRKPDNDDVQMHTAVHESAHAITAALALRILPSIVVTKTVSSICDGFCRINLPEKMTTKGVIRKRIMVALAGFLAEKMIFGDENTSMGVDNDIERATELANQAIKEYGMGSNPIKIHVQSSDTNDYFFNKRKYEEQAMNLIKECMAETENLLTRNKLLLLKMSQYLTEHSIIREQAIGEMVKYYGVEHWLKTDGFATKENYYSFKKMVMNQINELECNQGNTRQIISMLNPVYNYKAGS